MCCSGNNSERRLSVLDIDIPIGATGIWMINILLLTSIAHQKNLALVTWFGGRGVLTASDTKMFLNNYA
jgi:hypothetical protein